MEIKKNNFILIQEFMVTELELKANELLIYAIIFGFSQNNQRYNGSLNYLSEWTNTTKRSVINVLNSLVDKELIFKTEFTINGVKMVEYSTNGGGEKISPVVKKFHGGGEKFSPNNIDNNIVKEKYIINNIPKESEKNDKFIKPNIEEIKNYIIEIKANINPETFYNFYESNGWKVGKNPMKNWKAAIRTWKTKNNLSYNNNSSTNQIDLNKDLF